MAELGFVRAEPADTGRPGYDPRDLLKLYLYGYLHQVRSSRRLEAECRRNVEVMWLLGGLTPDYKSIAEFRRMHRGGDEAGAELVACAAGGIGSGRVGGYRRVEVPSRGQCGAVREREAVKRYLEQMSGPTSRTKWSSIRVRWLQRWRS